MKHKAEVPSTPLHGSRAGQKTSLHTEVAQGCRQCILCVDDEIAGTRIRGEILEEQGYSVVLYHDPLAALGCDLSMFALAVVDFQMPQLNGRELFLRMRALGARFPIVLLTGCVDALSYEDRVLFARCIDKGMPIQCLLDTIAEFMDTNQVPDFGASPGHQVVLFVTYTSGMPSNKCKFLWCMMRRSESSFGPWSGGGRTILSPVVDAFLCQTAMLA